MSKPSKSEVKKPQPNPMSITADVFQPISDEQAELTKGGYYCGRSKQWCSGSRYW